MTSVFAPFYGTSAAAPCAAAVAALMLQADPELTPGQVTQLLEQSAEPTTGPAMSGGAGLIQAPAAVQLALNLFHHS
jgi:subtilisin family serine protease